MPTFADLAKQGIRYHQLDDAAPSEQAQEGEGDGDFKRGLKKAMLQVPQTIGGTLALAGDLTGAEGLKEYGLGVYQNNSDKIQKITKDSDSLSNVLEGDASGADWLANSAGYVAGQAIQAVATGGVGGFIGSQLAKRGIRGVVARGAESLAAREVAQKVASKGATYGAGAALLGSNVVQEAGSIYPEALHVAAEEGRELDGGDKARVVGSALVAAGVDTAMDALMLGRVLKGGRKAGEGMLRAGVREIPGAMAREGVTEGIQTGIERYGAGQELGTADAIRDYVDSVGVGVVGGGMGGAASVLRSQKVPESGPLTRAANTAIEEQILQLGNDPQPMISFPDGSVGSKQDLHAYLTQFPEGEERQRKERELMGRDPETGKAIKPEAAPEPTHANTPEEEAAHMADWTAQHDPVDLDHAHAILGTPGAKGKGLMIAPHPDGGFTLVEGNKLTIDTQSRIADLQKPVKPAKENTDAVQPTADAGTVRPAAMQGDESGASDAAGQSGAAGAVPDASAATAAPALSEPEWKTNPYTAFGFIDRPTAEAFMAKRGANPAEFEAREIDGKFKIKRRAAQAIAEEVIHANDAVLAQDGSAGRGTSDQVADPAGSGDAIGNSTAAPLDRERGAAVDESGEPVQPADVRAAGSADTDTALDPDWQAFGPETGTLAIPRADMPQIKAEHRGALVNYLNARGITHQQEEIPADQLKPTQAEFSLSKVAKAAAREGGDRAILISSDNHVLDGHHQWLAALDAGQPVKVIRLDAPIAQLVQDVKEFPSATTEEAADVPERPQVPEEAPAAPGAQSAPQADAVLAEPAAEPAAAEPAKPVAKAKKAKARPGDDIPLAFYKKVKVPTEVHVAETGSTETVDLPADVALKSVREDIANLQSLLKCMKGGK